MNHRDTPNLPDSGDPHELLGLSAGASPEAVRAAYLEQVKRFPPDLEPDAFRRVRAAYEALTDPRLAMQALLEHSDVFDPIAQVLEGRVAKLRFVGPGLWLTVLKNSKRSPRPA